MVRHNTLLIANPRCSLISGQAEERQYDENKLVILFKSTATMHRQKVRKVISRVCYHETDVEQWALLLKTHCMRYLFNGKVDFLKPRQVIKWLLLEKLRGDDNGFLLLDEDGLDQPRFCHSPCVSAKRP